ncbi:MAG: sporulation protein YqfD [Agathobacter sp.]|nr:sporulation protein YqfD [Agathobacter sp.]
MYFFLQYITGYLNIEIIGENTRRLINLCASNKINLMNIKYIDDNKYSCVIKSNDVFKMIPHLKKTKTRFIIISKNGSTSFVKEFKKRSYCILLFLFTILATRDFASRMWKVSTVGNYKITSQQIKNVLEENGFCRGEKINNIKCKEIDGLLRENFKDFVWVSSSFNGTTLTILTKENILSEKEEKEYYGDILSSKDAIIASIITRSGKPLCHKGDMVNKGDVLVSTQVPIQDEYENDMGMYNAKADAQITGYVEYDYNKKYDITEKILKNTGKQKKSIIFGIKNHIFRIPVYISDFEYNDEMTKYYSVNPFDLLDSPFFVGVSLKNELEYVNKTNTIDEIKKKSEEDFDKFIDDLEQNGVLILSKNVIMDKVGDYVQTTGKIYCCEDIVNYSQER